MTTRQRPARSSTPSSTPLNLSAQVTARLGDTILDVRQVRGGPVRANAGFGWMIAGLGVVLSGVGLLGHELAGDWAEHRAASERAAIDEAPAPAAPGLGLGGLGFGLALLGLGPLGLGLWRRRERPEGAFTIGEGRGVSLTVPGDGLPDRAAFSLIERRGEALFLRFGAEMRGAIEGERRGSFAALAAAGDLADGDGVHALRLGEGARGSVGLGDLNLEVEVGAAMSLEVGRPPVDRPLWWSTAAAAVALGVPLVACQIAAEMPDPRADVAPASSRLLTYLHAPDEVPEEEAPEEEAPEEAEAAGGVGQRHRGEEGRMGSPTARSKAGLYAMRGPRDAVPQMARRFDPEMAARSSGILGTMSAQSGHFLASPYGGAFAVGNDDGDVWGGLVGTGYGVGGLGLGEGAIGERYGQIQERAWSQVSAEPLSTFSIDVDTAAYANVRRFLRNEALPPADAVRVEEMINTFDYGYAPPEAGHPLALSAEVTAAPWRPEHRLVRIGVKAVEIDASELPPRNLVFLIDTSGSMEWEGRLALVLDGLKMLADELRPEDRISVVTYAGASGVALDSTPGSQRPAIKAALERLRPSGGTNGGAGIWLAYRMAHKHFIQGGINRVILATDGDFNLGVSSHGELLKMIERERSRGVFLSVLGVGTGNTNDHTMEQLADRGDGNYSYLDSVDEARRVLVAQSAGTLATVAKDVKIQVEFNPAQVAAYRLVGYENRALAAEDFADDRKDAGELGAGEDVTALYEVIPAGAPVPGEGAPLRYQRVRSVLSAAAGSGELLTVKARYKRPDADASVPLEIAVRDGGAGIADASPQLRLAAAVAGFGLALRGSDRLGSWGLDEVRALLAGIDLDDPSGQIAELRELVGIARRLTGRQARR